MEQTFSDINDLKMLICNKLGPLIDNDYVLWDLPFHRNIGDTLIYQGELDFLSTLKHNCLDYSSHIFNDFPNLENDVIILLHGGGNFGDIYPEAQSYRRRVIDKYKNNKIILLPQSIHFNDVDNFKEDINIYNSHHDLHLFFRDYESYEFAMKNLNNSVKISLLPDMAFCIHPNNIEKYYPKNYLSVKSDLFLNRLDNEAIEGEYVLSNVDMLDWPTFQKRSFKMTFLFLITTFSYRFRFTNFILKPFITWYYNNFIKAYLIRTGVCFLYPYNTIYTTRLHGAILSVLMNKKIVLLDNSYGKNLRFYNQWLMEFKNIKIYEK